MKVIRVFPRKTKATPDDADVRIARFPGLFDEFDECDEVHIPVVFTWDIPIAEKLAEQWRHVATTKIGGPAYNDPGGDFTPGLYVKQGYVMTSRGCPNRCWFCSVPKREGDIRELPITEGHNLLDSNILACSDQHIKAVFSMLQDGKKKYRKPVEFTGGLEAARLKKWHCEELKKLKPKQLFFAYDTPDDLDPLIEAGKMLRNVGFTTASHALRCYVLCGYKGDTINKAEKRIEETVRAGFLPAAMLYRDSEGKRDYQWMKWQRVYMRPKISGKGVK